MTQKLSSVGIIPDGNRRYASKHNVSLLQAYSQGVRKAQDAVTWLDRYPSIKTVTFYTLSLENLQRNKAELSILLRLSKKQIQDAIKTKFFDEHEITPKFVGRLSELPKNLRDLMREAEEDFEGHPRTLNFAIAYTGRAEIVDASKRIAQEYRDGKIELEDVTEESFPSYLYSPMSFPELIFRTGDTKRLSGFLTYESAYSELYFSEKLWPEVEEADFKDAVEYYAKAQSRFGK